MPPSALTTRRAAGSRLNAWRLPLPSPTPVACAAALALCHPWLADRADAQTAPPPAALSAASAASAASAPSSAPRLGDEELEAAAAPLRISSSLAAPVGGTEAKDLPIYFEADRLDGTPGIKTHASGDVRLKRGDLLMRADDVTHTADSNVADAAGNVRITRRGDLFAGPALTLQLDTLQGEFTNPSYRFARTGAGGQAEKVEFLGNNKLRAIGATYTSCTPENTQDLDWVLTTSDVYMDFEANEGRAKNAVIRFMGVPILAAPVLTFPLSDERKSGFLPPSFDIDNKSGFELSVPYYWNIAPNRDATITPTVSTRRGAGMEGEFRYLSDSDRGTIDVMALPNDRVADRSRGMINARHTGELVQPGSPSLTNYEMQWNRVSDDDYWKDFTRSRNLITPRLYDSHASVERQINTRVWGLGNSQTSLYARVQSWQTLQDLDPDASPDARIITPYRREPQIGLRSRSASDAGLIWNFEAEANRFGNEDKSRVTGDRVHALATISRPFGNAGWHFTPKVSLNAASYTLDRNEASASTPRNQSRFIPTTSLDGGLVYERPIGWFGQDLVQTLEPRVQYVYTPYRKQSDLPQFDSAIRDFNQYSIFSENAFTGVDRVSDANQLTMGLTTRILSAGNGGEIMRLGVVQKVQFADQRITADDGPVNTQRWSDLLLLGSTSVVPHWYFDTTAQYSARDKRIERSLLGVRYNPGAYRTISANYRYTRDSSEQVDVGWQWPIAGRSPAAEAVASAMAQAVGAKPMGSNAGCGGTWYSVGRLNYSLKDSRLSDALVGLEYDGGCWIARVVAERTSIGRAEAATRLMFQLELVGLSRLGSSPLGALRDNIPGYRLLREDTGLLTAPPVPPSAYVNDE